MTRRFWFLGAGRLRVRVGGLACWTLAAGNILVRRKLLLERCLLLSRGGFPSSSFNLLRLISISRALLPANYLWASPCLFPNLCWSLRLSLCAQPATGMHLEERLARRAGSNEFRAAPEPDCLSHSPIPSPRSLLFIPLPFLRPASPSPCFLPVSPPSFRSPCFLLASLQTL